MLIYWPSPSSPSPNPGGNFPSVCHRRSPTTSQPRAHWDHPLTRAIRALESVHSRQWSKAKKPPESQSWREIVYLVRSDPSPPPPSPALNLEQLYDHLLWRGVDEIRKQSHRWGISRQLFIQQFPRLNFYLFLLLLSRYFPFTIVGRSRLSPQRRKFHSQLQSAQAANPSPVVVLYRIPTGPNNSAAWSAFH